ncbi:hypothetical protein L9G15_06170 [Shewanella sp. A3A]|nr:hypothetical protein [Shewanella ferrihydritica]
MKLILLPGMDGTGMLFGPLLNEIGDLDVEVIPLPNAGAQDYASLADTVAKIIGERECVLLVESYSGGIAEVLLKNYRLNIRHIVVVASFFSSPSRLLSRLAAILPIKALAAIPFLAPLAFKAFMLGWSASPSIIALFRMALRTVNATVLRMRLRQIAAYRATGFTSDISATYIRPLDDFLVSDRTQEFTAAFANLEIVEVPGPHFVLQVEPAACASVIRESVGHLTSKGNGMPSAPMR